MSILIIEDDPKVQLFLKECLEADFHPVVACSDLPVESELENLQGSPDTIILDRLIGNKDSKNSIEDLRKQFPDSSIIVLSAINNPVERSELLDLGVDDYMGKPFSIVELKSRIKALHRRNHRTQSQYIKLDNTVFDINQRTISASDKRVNLSGKEFELFYTFARNPGRVYSKYELLDKVWQANLEIESNVLEVTVMNLRKKLQEINSTVKINSKRNIGYWIET